MKDAASKGATVQTGLSEVSKIGDVSEQDTKGKDQKPVATSKTSIKCARPGKFNFR